MYIIYIFIYLILQDLNTMNYKNNLKSQSKLRTKPTNSRTKQIVFPAIFILLR